MPLQNTLRSSLTVFEISQRDEIFEAIGRHDLVSTPAALAYDSYRAVLERILNLEAAEFEILITELLSALGFEGTKHTGKSGDGGVDAIGELNVANLAKVKLFVQVKRYQLDAKISASVVKQLRQSIPHLGQGAFITTADFQKKAGAVALEEGFPRIGLVNGRQLVDLLLSFAKVMPKSFTKVNRTLQCRTTVSLANCAAGAWLQPAAL